MVETLIASAVFAAAGTAQGQLGPHPNYASPMQVTHGQVGGEGGQRGIVESAGFTADLFVCEPNVGCGYVSSTGGTAVYSWGMGQNAGTGVVGEQYRLDASESRRFKPNPTGGPDLIESSVHLSWYEAGGLPLLSTGLSFTGNNPINTIGIDVGLFRLSGNQYYMFDEPILEIKSAVTTFYDTAGSVLLQQATSFYGNDGLGTLAGFGIGIGPDKFALQDSASTAPGADIGTIPIGRIDVDYVINKVPTPGAIATFGVAGLALIRRRR
jgi:hypothetical protein